MPFGMGLIWSFDEISLHQAIGGLFGSLDTNSDMNSDSNSDINIG
jgi:hypothetical protein